MGRMSGTGPGSVLRSLAFYVVFYGGTVFLVLAAFFAMLFGRSAFVRMVHCWSAWHRGCARWVLGIDVTVEGEVPSGEVLVALRHESFFEAIDLPTLLPYPAVFAKAELLRIPLWGRAGEIYGLVGVERAQGAKTLRTMIAAARAMLAEGRPLAIFPEGTRVPHGHPGEMQSGFAGLYKLLGVPVVPIAVNSGPLYHRWWKRKGTVTYRIGAMIEPGLPREEIEARVQEAIGALNGS